MTIGSKLWIANSPLVSVPTVELTAERWHHIVTRHAEMVGKEHLVYRTVVSPTVIVAGNPPTNLVFVNQGETKSAGQPLVVIVNEPRGFVCTALYDRRYAIIDRQV